MPADSDTRHRPRSAQVRRVTHTHCCFYSVEGNPQNCFRLRAECKQQGSTLPRPAYRRFTRDHTPHGYRSRVKALSHLQLVSRLQFSPSAVESPSLTHAGAQKRREQIILHSARALAGWAAAA
eukprot:2516771-Prymnesium_polylepis.1